MPRPRLSARRIGRSTGSITAHCSSFSSQRPVMAVRGYPRAAPGSNEFHLSGIYETGSRLGRTFATGLPEYAHDSIFDSTLRYLGDTQCAPGHTDEWKPSSIIPKKS
jgi:hypothetical protein